MKTSLTKLISMMTGFALVSGCGQEFIADGPEGVVQPHDPGGVFNDGSDDTVYRTASYETLRFTLSISLGLGSTIAPGAADLCNGADLATNCPRANPLGFLDANKRALGVAVYDQEDPLATQAPGPMSSGGYKAWSLAASAACGRMMMEQSSPKLFPNGNVADYTKVYQILLGRMPLERETEVLDALRATYTSVATRPVPLTQGTVRGPTPTLNQLQGAAVCSAVLGSLEFLMVN